MNFRKLFFLFVLVIMCLGSHISSAQSTDSTTINFGIWQSLADKINTVFTEMNGRLSNFKWKDIEVSPNVWVWTQFDSNFTALAKDNLPFIFLIYTKQDAPDWLYTNGIPKVIEKDALGNTTGYAPYYANDDYKFYFKRMIRVVRQHVETLPDSVRRQVLGVQACLGSTGDYIGYKGSVEPQYFLSAPDLLALFKEFNKYYYDEYINTYPKIYLISNPSNDGDSEISWLTEKCPGGWIKTGSIGKGFQLNDEKTKNTWLYGILNTQQNGAYIRSRSEITGDATTAGWWLRAPYKNMFALMCYDVFWGLDMNNQGVGQLSDPLFDASFNFFKKYTRSSTQKDPAKSTWAMCALRDGLDAADEVRFPSTTYGIADRSNTQRYQNIANRFIAFGAKLEDPLTATLKELDNFKANGTNDVGWDVFSGNYERSLHQITPNETSIGYWNIGSIDTNSMYGKFARGFDIAANKKALYFDVDDTFLGNTPLNGGYAVMIDITYLDKGTGIFRLFYDSKLGGTSKQSMQVTCTNTGLWKKASITLYDAFFGNRGINAADFYIKSINDENVLFSIIELSRPNENSSNVGLFGSIVPAFDTICLNGASQVRSFVLNGAFLNGSNLRIGPLNGYQFSTEPEGNYSDTLFITNYGTTIDKTVYLKLIPLSVGTYPGNLPIRGGGYAPFLLTFLGGSVTNSRPLLSANVSAVSCYKNDNGAIDLNITSGTGPFTYSWSNSVSPNLKFTTQDIANLKPADYTVVITSQAACTTTATYTITEPDALEMAISKDNDIICRNGTTSVTVTATGGNTPYNGIGKFIVNSGSNPYTVIDAKGCIATDNFFILDGTLTPPFKPYSILGVDATAIGLCEGGDFNYSVNDVNNATFYTWIPPAGCKIIPPNSTGTSIILRAPANFNGGTLSVKAGNVCGISDLTSKTLTLTPGKPSAIQGPQTVEREQAGLVYTVAPAVPGIRYTWVANMGARITSGQNTSSITVTWGIQNGKVTARAANNCVTSGGTSINVNIPGLPMSETIDEAVEGSDENDPISTTRTFAGTHNYFRVVPNPVKDVAHIFFSADTEYKFSIELTDLVGRSLINNSGSAKKGENNIDLNLTNYANGVYLVTLITEKGRRKTIKLLKSQ